MCRKIFIAFIFFLILANSEKTQAQTITRYPYLQVGTSSSVTIRWLTDKNDITKVFYGESPTNKVQTYVDNTQAVTHVAKLSNLKSNTKYYYSVVVNNTLIGDESYYFITAPLNGEIKKSRFVTLGDCGTGTPNQIKVKQQIQNYFGSTPIDGLLLLGDNAYNYGQQADFQARFFDVYKGSFLQNTFLWPAPGNHDYADRLIWPNDWGSQPDYYRIFSMPTQAEAGGVASNSQSYYSFNYSNIHFVSLDSYGSENNKRMSDTLSNQITWLKKDLSQNTQKWTIVFFHHPPYTKGTHNSDTEDELIAIRKNLVKVLENNNVDLVLNGHSHTYERSLPIHNFYSNSEEFDASKYAISTSSGKYDNSSNSCPYVKKSNEIVYVVAGTSGWYGAKTTGFPHHAMYYSNATITGSMILEVEDNRLDAKFLSENGDILDKFTLLKNVNKTLTQSISCGDAINLNASWVGDYVWSKNGSNTRQISVDNLNTTTTFTVKDKFNCLMDQFVVNVNPLPNFNITSNSPVNAYGTLNLKSDYQGAGIISWTGPNNFKGTGATVSLANVNDKNAGEYMATANYKTCSSTNKTKVVIVSPLGIEETHNTFSIYPNPILNSEINLQLLSKDNFEGEMRIIDEKGRFLESNPLNFTVKNQIISLKSENLPNYFIIEIIGKDFKAAYKIIKE